MNINYQLILSCSAWSLTGLALADDASTPSITGGLTATAQTASDQRISSEAQGSFDLFGILALGSGTLNIHAEGSTTPDADGILGIIGEANGDAGTALDRDNQGRLQVSELFYSFTWNNATLGIGLLDAAAGLDTSSVANDENTQFLANPLINNSTIAFPDYTLGLTLDAEPQKAGFGYHFFLGSSHGIADNPQKEYAELVDLDNQGKGIFAAGEGVWNTGNLTARIGTWINTSDHQRLNGDPGLTNNYGIYGSIDGSLGDGAWNLRTGWADPSVSPAVWNLGVAMTYPMGNQTTAGIGLVHTKVSSDVGANTDNNLLAEVYLRFQLSAHFEVTPLIQYVQNPGFNTSPALSTGEALDQNQWVAAVRVHVPF